MTVSPNSRNISNSLPEKDVSEILEAFTEVIKVHAQLRSVLESLQKESSKDQKIGGAFMQFAPKIKSVHLAYCGLHPHFVSIIEKNKDLVSTFIKKVTNPDATNGSVLLTSSLSYSFRRLDKYPALLQELQRYTDECHPDRGDTQRAGFLYRELVSAALELRRKKEMELEVMLGNIKNWPLDVIGPVDSLGNIIQMGPVTVVYSPGGSDIKKDRYLVLFEKHLLLLTISNEMTSFTFEHSLLLTDMTLSRLPEPHATSAKSTFEILMPGHDNDTTNRFSFECSSVDETRNWITLMQKCKTSAAEKVGALSTLRSNSGSLRREKAEQQPSHLDSLSKRITNLTSESSSLSSGSLNIAKGVMQETRSSYWANKSLLPHPPLRSPLNTSLENGIKSSSISTLSTIHDRRPSSPSDDMAILQVIESYYFTGRKNQNQPPADETPQILLVDDENIAVETPCHHDAGNANSAFTVDERNLVVTVNALVNEISQMRQEIDSLATCIQKERKARKRLKHFVGKLTLGGEDIDT